METLSFMHERQELAAAFRLAARNNWHEAVANHFSLSVSDDGKKFLINPSGVHFSQIKASDLVLCDADDKAATFSQQLAPDPTAWGIHSAFHRHSSKARACLHVHSDFATVLACLKKPELPPIDQMTAKYYNRIGYDDGFGGMGFDDEGDRIAKTLGNHQILLMGNHGVTAVAESVARAFDELYYFERACALYIRAVSTGLPLNVMSSEIAESTAQEWENYPNSPWQLHFESMCRILDAEEPDYRA